ncbi:MAG: dihydrolipoyl dehydrogenase [Clostridia bacterium]|nr:dihydrolipoyl dehydrogenase [Clostridia bacterium]
MTYDLIVIGGGPAGYCGAIRASQCGLKVALFEKDKVGGTCLNRGCVPTKALLNYASKYEELFRLGDIGISLSEPSFDFSAMHRKKAGVVSTLRDGVERLLKANGVELIFGEARIASANSVLCGGEEYSAKHILIASGSVPASPPISGRELALSSDDILEGSDRFYNSLAIIGGGVIGVEVASVFRSLGSEVHIFEAMDRIIPMMDRELSQSLAMALKKKGVAVHVGASAASIEKGERYVVNYTEKGVQHSLCTDGVLICTGRRPYIDGLFDSNFALEMNGRAIAVDEKYRTSVKNIYAVGDVNGLHQLAHAAEAQALAAVADIIGEAPAIDPRLVPSCIYTDPEIASAGLTADEAKQRGIAVRTGKYVMSSNSKTIIEGKDRSFIKLLFDENTDRILGAQLFCAHATDMISELTQAIANGLTSRELLKGLRPHPTFVEGITEAIEASHGQSIHSMPSRRNI